MNKPIYHTISEKLWPGEIQSEKKNLFKLLVPLVILFLGALFHFIFRLIAGNSVPCILCDAGLVLVSLLAITCLLNKRINCVLNTTYSIPLFVYAYYISDLSLHPQLTNTVYHSVGLLLAGGFFLLYFSQSESKIVLYSLLSIITIVFQLIKGGQFFGFLAGPDFIIPHPLIIFLFVFTGGFLIRRKFRLIAGQWSETVLTIRQNVSKVLRDTTFPVAEISSIRDEQGNVLRLQVERVNNAFESVFNIQLHEVKGQEANYIFDLALREHLDLNKILLFGNTRVKEFHATKLELWFKIHILKSGINSTYVILEDITKIKKKLEELENSKRRYKVLLEAIPDMFFVIGKDGTYEDFLIKENDFFKVEDANIIGSTIFDVGFPENMAEKILNCIHNCLKRNSIETIEYSLNTPNGTYFFEMRLARLTARSVISVSRDITRRKTAEFNLERAKLKAEESDRLKSAFLANLSHEIRTPLNLITNFTQMLTEEGLSRAERSEFSNAISQNGTQLLNMIDNTIHLSKIETNTIEIKMKFCPVNVLIRDVYNHFRPLIPEGKQIKMNLNLDVPNSEFGFVTDRRLLLESLNILVDNAIKYTTQGEIYLGYEMMRNERVKFIIADTGIGIPQEEMMNIFSRFYRIKNEINDLTSGSGIGLPIAQHYIHLLGGELQLESVPGKGTSFWFLLPFREGKGYLRVVS